ncbi:hypothetical protein B0H13DRAFT_1877113 [Mycena leptocephala]|nr:hypothetical protein B0H13DRAFT_1877113 [Mycena leptocephala]
MSKHTNEGHPKPSAATQKPRAVRSLIPIRKIGVGETSEKRRSAGTETLAANSEFTSPPRARDVPKPPNPSAKKAEGTESQAITGDLDVLTASEVLFILPLVREGKTTAGKCTAVRLPEGEDDGIERVPVSRGAQMRKDENTSEDECNAVRTPRAQQGRMIRCGADLRWTRGRKLKPHLASSTSGREGRHPEAPQSSRDRACGRIETRRRSLAESSSKVDTEVRAHEEEGCGTKNTVSSEAKGRAGNSYCSKGGCAGPRIAIFPTKGTALAIVAWSEVRIVHEDGVSSRGPLRAPDLPTSMRKAWQHEMRCSLARRIKGWAQLHPASSS